MMYSRKVEVGRILYAPYPEIVQRMLGSPNPPAAPEPGLFTDGEFRVAAEIAADIIFEELAGEAVNEQ